MLTLADLQDLTDPQRTILEALAKTPELSDIFYLTGGTLLKALGIVPRQSNDLDFFTFPTIDSLQFTQHLRRILELLQKTFGKDTIVITQDGFMHSPSGMLIDAVADGVENIDGFVLFESLKTAGLKDLAASKASAICSRDELKDYIDIAFLTRHAGWSLKDLADLAEQKFQLGTVTEEKLLTELIAKQDMFTIPEEIFLRDGKANRAFVEQQINVLLKQTTL